LLHHASLSPSSPLSWEEEVVLDEEHTRAAVASVVAFSSPSPPFFPFWIITIQTVGISPWKLSDIAASASTLRAGREHTVAFHTTVCLPPIQRRLLCHGNIFPTARALHKSDLDSDQRLPLLGHVYCMTDTTVAKTLTCLICSPVVATVETKSHGIPPWFW
tara:strand:+ start:10391 stop:10873 length:483 start_codon:yes stop_codon:yes gene_type:complete